MAQAEVMAGNCGFTTRVIATQEDKIVTLEIHSECKAIQKMATALTQVNPFDEISFRRGMPHILKTSVAYCTHAACPVPVAIIKAVEVEAGLALPSDVTIKLSR